MPSTLLTDTTAVETPAEGTTPTDTTTPATPPAVAENAVVEGEQPAEGSETPKEGGESEDTPEGAPETYADFTFEDGVELNKEVLDEFKVIAKELNLPQAAAQRVADLGAALASKFVETQQQQAVETASAWAEQVKADKEIGGDKLSATLTAARKALSQFGSDDLRTLLSGTGFGNHPELIRMLAKVGAAVSEDKIVASGDAGGPPAKNPGSKLYPNMAN